MVRRNKPKQLPEYTLKPLVYDLRYLREKLRDASSGVSTATDHYRAIVDLQEAVCAFFAVVAPAENVSTFEAQMGRNFRL